MAQVSGVPNGDVWRKEEPLQLSGCVVLEQDGAQLKILQLTDIHLGQYTRNRARTARKIKRMAIKERPDLIVVTGDFTALDDNESDTQWLIDTMENIGRPWGVCFGNHDSQGNYDRYYLANMLEKSRNCLFCQGPGNIGGVGNYVIAVTNKGKLMSAVILLDSHTSFTRDGLEYEALTPAQVAWYEWVITGLNGLYGQKRAIPSVLFLHIPLPEYQQAWECGKLLLGEMGEDKVYAARENTGMFRKVVELGSTKGIFAGHDHANTFCSVYQGVILGYGTQTRFNKTKREGRKGASVIRLDAERIDTYQVPYSIF